MINGSLSVYQFDNRDMRTFTDESGTVWFVGKDVAKILGYQNLSKAVADHVDDDDKGVTKRYTLGGAQNAIRKNKL